MKERKKKKNRRRQVFFFFFFFFSFSIHAIVFNIYLFPCSLPFFSFPYLIHHQPGDQKPNLPDSFRWKKEVETKTTREKVTPDTLNDTPHKKKPHKRTTKEEEKERRRREEEKEAEKRGEERKEEKAGRQAGRQEGGYFW